MFFLSGDYEAIGSLEENLMIIPDLKSQLKKISIIGLSGGIASGKTTVGKIFEENGYKYIRYSQIIEKMLIEKKLIVNRENLQKLGNEINKNQIELSKRIYEEIKYYEKVVIDGLRHPEDYTYFFETYGFNFNLISPNIFTISSSLISASPINSFILERVIGSLYKNKTEEIFFIKLSFSIF